MTDFLSKKMKLCRYYMPKSPTDKIRASNSVVLYRMRGKANADSRIRIAVTSKNRELERKKPF